MSIKTFRVDLVDEDTDTVIASYDTPQLDDIKERGMYWDDMLRRFKIAAEAAVENQLKEEL